MKDIQVEGKTIFAVDDDPAILLLIQTILELFGMTVLGFLNGQDMLDASKTHLPDLILLDIEMPSGMDGFEVCRHLKADKILEEIPVIFLSGASDVVNKVKGFEIGAMDFLQKPVQTGELIARVKTHLVSSQLKKDLKISEAKYRSMMESMIDPVYIASSECIVEYMNPAMIKRTRGNAVGEICHLALHGLDRRCEWCALDKVKESRSMEAHFVGPRDNRRYQVTNMPIHQGDGRVSNMAIMKDVTDFWNALEEKKKAENQLHQDRKMKSIGQLAAGIAHEINTPIQYVRDNMSFLETAFSDLMSVAKFSRAIMGTIKSGHIPGEMIKKLETALEDSDLEYCEKEIPLALQQSIDGTNRVSKIVRSMKEFSHPGGGEELTDINRALENTIAITRNEWKYVSTMTCEFDESLPRVSCVPGELNQVFLNMILNAGQAIGEALGISRESKGLIHIKTQRKDNWVQISIKDTGKGIIKENQHRIFDPFFTTKEIGKGTGQGLTVSYAVIVDKHKGKIECESEPGKGTTFIISLPVEEH